MLTAGIDISRLSRADKEELDALLAEKDRRKGQRLFYAMYPEADTAWDGPTVVKTIRRGTVLHARSRYPKHLEFFEAGALYRERLAMCANRIGKTLGMGAYEMACHLTGQYPGWWPGRRFAYAIDAWAAGKSNETTRDIVQLALFGEVTRGMPKGVTGTGMVPGDCIGPMIWKSGFQDLIDTVKVRHVSGDWSILGLKSYEQGRGSFEGTAKDVIWFDEEPPYEVYDEALIRTATTGGMTMITFTPLEGHSQVVMSFLPADQRPADPDEIRASLATAF
jgi:phage terminase large subunit-like protein